MAQTYRFADFELRPVERCLLRRVWPGLVIEEANVHVQVSQLRQRLGADAIATTDGQLGQRCRCAGPP